MKFTKMHGAGNDYVYVDCTNGVLPDNISDLAIKISDRHFGIGSDGLVLICKSDVADFKMRMFNSDGSEAQMCGNASRCIGKFVYDKGLTTKTELTLETLAGIKHLTLFIEDETTHGGVSANNTSSGKVSDNNTSSGKVSDNNTSSGKVSKVRVDMGEPILEPAKIPVKSTTDKVIAMPYSSPNCEQFNITCVSMGNPHCIIYVDDVNTFDVHTIGKHIENDYSVFPERTNVEFVQVIDKQNLAMRVWERGAGETLACGTGACATLVATVLNNKCDNKARLKLIGGDLDIEWDRTTNHVLMTGGATTVFEGEYIS
jgi:diaminopimelate epimerase